MTRAAALKVLTGLRRSRMRDSAPTDRDMAAMKKHQSSEVGLPENTSAVAKRSVEEQAELACAACSVTNSDRPSIVQPWRRQGRRTNPGQMTSTTLPFFVAIDCWQRQTISGAPMMRSIYRSLILRTSTKGDSKATDQPI